MKACITILSCLGALAAFSACTGGKSAATPTTAVSPAATGGTTAIPSKSVPPTPPPFDPGSKLTVQGGPIGGTASATMHADAGTACSITYIHPSGKTSTLTSLTPKTAGADGIVSWTWSIDPGTKPAGQGTVTVACGNVQASQPITIAPASTPAASPTA